jgi:membrane-associated HD superfamily phosphohydrolase
VEAGDHPHRRSTDKWVAKPVIVAFVIVTVIFLATLIGFAWVVTDVQHNGTHIQNLSVENKNRIKDIQISRIESCKKTYEGIREVFKPFFPKDPKTKRQIENLELFNTTIDNLKKGCEKQTKAK